MRTLSKSKIMSFRQCPKKLWLEIHHPELLKHSEASEANFQIGYQVGAIAQSIYDPQSSGAVIDIKTEGFQQALDRSKELLNSAIPIFEAGFSSSGGLAFADIMMPDELDGIRAWRMIEVKSSTSVKDYHRDDVAVQTYIAKASGILLKSISLAHIDSSWTYPGNLEYSGLLVEEDLTQETLARGEEVKSWISQAQKVIQEEEPATKIGDHCNTPFDCGFYEYCGRHEVKAEYPLNWLPRLGLKKVNELLENGINDLREVPDQFLNSTQKLVRDHTKNNTVYFDSKGASKSLSGLPLPAYFLDFETIQFAVPIWKGTRPYQQITFQFSLHILNENQTLEHAEFLDLSAEDPSQNFATSLLNFCGTDGPIFVYNAGFETARIRELAERYPELKDQLLAINERVVDLLPIARNYYYHPSQQGSWSIKKVLPALVPELSYENLDGVKDGGMAMNAYLEAIHPSTSSERKTIINRQLLEYCKLDTYAMVKLWQVFANRNDLEL
jgi:CRISPR/Cas system-associated exonuclease Cas4 (RecB family)